MVRRQGRLSFVVVARPGVGWTIGFPPAMIGSEVRMAKQRTDTSGFDPIEKLSGTVDAFRPCFRRKDVWKWFVIILAGFMVRQDTLGVTSMVRWLDLAPVSYTSLLHFLRSNAWDLGEVLKRWRHQCRAMLPLVCIEGRFILAGDHTVNPKDGVKSPGVKTLHQHSETSSKPGFFRGQVWGFISLLAQRGNVLHAVPVDGWLEPAGPGPVEDRSGSGDMMTRMIESAVQAAQDLNHACIVVLDAYFACGKVFQLLAGHAGSHAVNVVTRAKRSYVAYTYQALDSGKVRPLDRVKLRGRFTEGQETWPSRKLQLYNGKTEDVRCTSQVLWWPPAQRLLLFVWASSSRGAIVLMSSDLELSAWNVLKIYALRTRIETFFDTLKNIFGGLTARFWQYDVDAQPRRPRRNKKQALPSPDQIQRAWRATERLVNLAAISVGICQMFRLCWPGPLTKSDCLWQRTARSAVPSVRLIRQLIGKRIGDRLATLEKINPNAVLSVVAPASGSTAGQRQTGEESRMPESRDGELDSVEYIDLLEREGKKVLAG